MAILLLGLFVRIGGERRVGCRKSVAPSLDQASRRCAHGKRLCGFNSVLLAAQIQFFGGHNSPQCPCLKDTGDHKCDQLVGHENGSRGHRGMHCDRNHRRLSDCPFEENDKHVNAASIGTGNIGLTIRRDEPTALLGFLAAPGGCISAGARAGKEMEEDSVSYPPLLPREVAALPLRW